jgi:octaheme c-type cytochrome (tetrathionate reductase family)
MKNFFATLSAVLIPVVVTVVIFIGEQKQEHEHLEQLRLEYSQDYSAPADHSKFEGLQKKFDNAHEVTEACISCHNERHKEVMKTSHWNWERTEYIKGRGIISLGKKNVFNNCCIGISGSQKACTRCHVGYGYKDDSFDFTNPRNIDCLVCHENSGDYFKGSGMAGYPAPDVDLTKVAQNVGLPQRLNCGICHFYSGGGNNVKHGDLEEALFNCKRDVDVHMASNGMNMECVDCHEATNHQMKGKLYSVSSMDRNRATCEQCHTNNPHTNTIINEHTLKVSCQTCHIPTYAKVNATKLTWDWSTAGKLRNGLPYHVEDEEGNHIYLSIKGTFTWGKDLEPEYCWFNGTANHYLFGDPVDTSKAIQINTLYGNYQDEESKIIPVKVIRSKQIFDCNNKALVQPKLWAEKEGEGAYWLDFDWNEAAKKGMEEAGLPYSGNYCFVRTEMYWPVNHMVSPKEESLSCIDCHNRNNSRLAGLDDFYMPGRDYNPTIDTAGTYLLILSFLGVALHAFMRIISRKQ